MRAKGAVGTLHPEFIVGIGGSAGALNAYIAFLDALPHDTGMAFVIISHMNPSAYSQLAAILSRHAKMPVIMASDKMRVQRNHVYVISPDSGLLIVNYTFKVLSPRAERNKLIDLFFISLAEVMGKHAIGIVLSGYNGDGTEGCKKIKEAGGITFVQDMSAEVPEMPLAAQASGFVDFVLPPDKIATELKRLATAVVPL